MNYWIRNMRIIVVVCLAGAVLAGAARAAAPADAKARGEREAKLIETLKGSAARAEKDKACRELQIIGTPACIPTLAALLADKDLSHMARWALEPMPYPEAAKALRDALPKTSGLIKVGVISSLGFRRDKEAVGDLAKSLDDRNAAVAGAAAAALGRIGTPEAAKALNKFRADAPKALQAVVAEASLTAAQRLLDQGNKEQAAAIYEALQANKWPKHVRLGAFGGLLAAKPTEGVGRVTKAIAGDDPAMRGAAIAAIPAMKGPGVAERFAAELPKLPADAQVLLIGVLADRGDRAVCPAIAAAAGSANPQVRTAAAKALGAIGDASCVEILCKAVVEGKSDEEKKVAAVSLQRLGGDGVDAALVKFMKSAPAGARPELIKALVARKAGGAVGDLLAEAKGPDEGVRRAALRALGVLGEPKDLPAVLKILTEQKGDTTRKDAERAVMQVSRKITDPTRQGDAALAALGKAAAMPAKCSLLRVLGGIGNAKALEAVRGALKDKDLQVREAAVVALADWPDAGALDALLDVFRTTDNQTHRVLALRGCVRILGLGSQPAQERLKTYTELMKASRRGEDKKLVLAGLANVADPTALAAVEPFLADARVGAEAELAMLGIARGIMGSAPKQAKEAANKLLAKSKSKAVRRQAEEIIAQAGRFQDYIVAWQISGPYRERGKTGQRLFNVVFPPEKGAKDVKWKALPVGGQKDQPWMFDLTASPGGNQCVAYVRTWIHSGQGQPARLEMGVDDSIKAWLNGKLVHKNAAAGAAVAGEEKAKVSLKQGWNLLLLKIVQHTGPWEFCARLRTPDGGALGGVRVDPAHEGSPGAKGPAGAKGSAAGWTPLFNGKDLTGWRKTGSAIFKVQDGCLVGTQTTGKGGDLWTEADFDDFELRVTYRMVWPANSGFWFRHDGKKGYQYDVLKYKKPVAFSGTLYCPGKMFITKNLKESLENRDGWNEARLRAQGDELTLWLNGTQTGQCRDKTLRKGKIGIQVHGGNGFKGMKMIIKKMEVRTLAAQASTGTVRFVMHRVGRYRSESCGVGDFNKDGKLDIIAGPYWYEAPAWKPHKFRELSGEVTEDGKGYRDDFMNVPLDVDGDGLLDLVTCCWFAKQMQWYRNTGKKGGQWPMTVAEKNGNYEMGDLWDVDGDGKAREIVPATKHTAWFEVGTGKDGKRGLIRHNVCDKPRAYGNGVGDVNGDGRPDLLRPDAWLEAPEDPRKGKWKEHPLALGSATPGKADHTPQILVYDVDGDKLNDIVTSNAHKYGIFWYRQVRKGKGITWQQHVIDKTWSQAHSLALADLDGDGDLDLITGKRYLAHNGKDPGSGEPLGVYWYELNRKGGVTWTKHAISYKEGIGSSLNACVVDLDRDGDLDVVVTGKWGGPVYFENKLKSADK